MKKILVAIDGSYYSDAALEYALQWAEPCHTHVTGIFLEDITAYHQFSPVLEAPEAAGLADEVLQELQQESKDRMSAVMDKFSDRCNRAGISWGLVSEVGVPSLNLIAETLYADICIVGAVTYFSPLTYSGDAGLLSDLLTKAHCPVLVVPERVMPIRQVVLAYDGSTPSIMAIKRYLTLFPEMSGQWGHTLLTVAPVNQAGILHETEMLHYVRLHFPDLQRVVLRGDTVEEMLHYGSQEEGSLLVMGSFTRNAISKLFKPSVGKQVVEAQLLPVLVAH